MHRVWVILLAGCGFESPAASGACWTISDTTFPASACVTTLADPIEMTVSTSIDTDTGVSNPAGFGCAELTVDSAKVCALVASTITIDPRVQLSAHGTRPLALFAHAI